MGDDGVLLAGCGPEIQLPSTAGRIGLRNLGNTCFMNAGLQCLSHLEPFAAYFLSGRYLEDINSTNLLGCKGELARAFADLQKLIWQSEKSPQKPKELHTKLKSFAPHLFQGYEQQDVQEFLAFCLDGLHEDLNRVTTRPRPQTDQEEKDDEALAKEQSEEFGAALAWMRHLERGRSFLVDLLQGQLRSTLTCNNCGNLSHRFDPFLYLSLPVEKSMSKVSDAIEKYLEEELLSGTERWHCDKCKKKVDARKKIDLWKLPPILVLHLKRFEFDSRTSRFRKTDVALSSPSMIDLAGYVSSWQRDGACYDVVCIANHTGSFGGGHYTATCRVGDSDKGTWHHFNDERVSKVKSPANERSREAYVIFLVRCTATGQSAAVRANSLKRQTVSMPELWPHWVSAQNSTIAEALHGFKRSEAGEGGASGSDESPKSERPHAHVPAPVSTGSSAESSDRGASADGQTPVSGGNDSGTGMSARAATSKASKLRSFLCFSQRRPPRSPR